MKYKKLLNLILILSFFGFITFIISSCKKTEKTVIEPQEEEQVTISDNNIQANTRNTIIGNYENENNFSFDSIGLFHNEVCLFVINQTRHLTYSSFTERFNHFKSLIETEYGYSPSIENHIDSNGELIEKSFENAIGLSENEKIILINLRNGAYNHDWDAENAISNWKDYADLVAENAIINNTPNLEKLLTVISIAKHSSELWVNEYQLSGNQQVQFTVWCKVEAAVQDAAYVAENCSDLDFPCAAGTITHSLSSYYKCLDED